MGRKKLQDMKMDIGSIDSGSPDALDAYKDKWKKKLDLYGPDGLRERVVREGESTRGQLRPQIAAQPAPCVAPLPDRMHSHQFEPPVRLNAVTSPTGPGRSVPTSVADFRESAT